jgi:hypothetical protein
VRRARGELRAGLRYAARVPAIARPLLMMALIGMFTFEFEVSLPLRRSAQLTHVPDDVAGRAVLGQLDVVDDRAVAQPDQAFGPGGDLRVV